MLPPPCRWIDYDAYSCLMWHYGCVAVVYLDGRVVLQWGAGLEAKAASLEQGKRHVERWVSARPGLPPGKRAMAMRARMRSPMDVGAFTAQILHRPKNEEGPKRA